MLTTLNGQPVPFDAVVPWSRHACLVYGQLRINRLGHGPSEWGITHLRWRQANSLAGRGDATSKRQSSKDALAELIILGLIKEVSRGDRVCRFELFHPRLWPVQDWEKHRSSRALLLERAEAIVALHRA